jgi:hypothetical protein
MFEEKKEIEEAAKSQLAGRKKGRVTKEATKKMEKGNKKSTIEIGESEEEKKNDKIQMERF